MDETTKEIVERLTRLIGEGRDYDEDTEAMIVAKGIITSLSERVGELDALLAEALETLDTIGLEPTDPNDGINHGRNGMMVARAVAKFLRTRLPSERALLSKQEER